MEQGAPAHLALAKDDHQLEQGFRVVVSIEEGETPRQEGEKHDACRPNVEGSSLVLALEEHLGSSEASSACTVGADALTGVVFTYADALDLLRWTHDGVRPSLSTR